jgi:hypothetical protein
MVKSTMFKSTISAAVLAAGMFFVSPAFAADAQFNVPLDCDDHDIIVMGILNTTTGVTLADMAYNGTLTVIFDDKILTTDLIVAILAEFGFEATYLIPQENLVGA